jgi:hypothetical protein
MLKTWDEASPVSNSFHASSKNMETGKMPVLRLKPASLPILTDVFSEICFGNCYNTSSHNPYPNGF